jgi:hypothetical protein
MTISESQNHFDLSNAQRIMKQNNAKNISGNARPGYAINQNFPVFIKGTRHTRR